MFDKILIKSNGYSNGNGGLDIQNLVDSMLFYNEVHIIVSQFELKQLLDTFTIDSLSKLIESKRLFLHLCDQHFGVGEHGSKYSIDLFSRNINDTEKLLSIFLDSVYKDQDTNHRLASRLAPIVTIYKYPFAVNELLQKDICDVNFVTKIIKQHIANEYPEYGDVNNLEFICRPIEKTPSFFGIEHNINIEAINTIIKNRGLCYKFNPSHLLFQIGETNIDCYAASAFGSELLANSTYANAYKLRMNTSVERANQRNEEINLFQQTFALPFLSLGEAYVKNKISNDKLIELINHDDSVSFRSWTSKLNEESMLNGECYESMCDKLRDKPVSKIIRYVIPTIIGAIPLIGAVAGPLLSAFDQFVFDRLKDGWRPNIFLNNVIRDETLKK